MSRLPDRFDFWVRRARGQADPARQLDYVLGALVALPHWHFLNVGTAEEPQAGTTEVEGARQLLVFSDAQRVVELALELKRKPSSDKPPVISVPMPAALTWCLTDGPKCDGLLINFGEDAVVIPLEHVAAFAREWEERRASQPTGFWIPNLTSQEEDFWQEHGL